MGTAAALDGAHVRIRLKPGAVPAALRGADNIELSVPQTLGRKGLRTLVHTLLSAEPPLPDFHFLVNEEPLRTTLDNFIARRSLSAEKTLDVVYYIPLPQPEQEPPVSVSDSWISAIAATSGKNAFVLTGSCAGVPSILNGTETVLSEDQLKTHAHKAPIKAVAWLPDQKHFLTASMDESACIWRFDSDAPEARRIASFSTEQIGTPVSLTSAAVSEKHSLGIVGAANGSLWVLPELLDTEETSNGKRKAPDVRSIQGEPLGSSESGLNISDIAFLQDDAIVVGWDGLARVWDVNARSMKVSIPCGGKAVTSVSPSRSSFLISAVDGGIRLVDTRGEKGVVGACGRRGAHKGVVADACWIEEGQSAVSGGMDGTVRIWDMRAMVTPVHCVDKVHGGGRCLAVCCTRGGDRVIYCGGEGGKIVALRI